MKPRATRFSTCPAPSPGAIITGSAPDKTVPEPWRQAPLDDMMDLYDDADRGVYRRVSDTLLRDRWGAELAVPWPPTKGECQTASPDTACAAAADKTV